MKVMLAALLAALALATGAVAGGTKPTLTASPNPAFSGDLVTVSGCGFPAAVDLRATNSAGGGIHWFDVETTAGCFSVSYPLWAGTWTYVASKMGNSARVYASVAFMVLAP